MTPWSQPMATAWPAALSSRIPQRTPLEQRLVAHIWRTAGKLSRRSQIAAVRSLALRPPPTARAGTWRNSTPAGSSAKTGWPRNRSGRVVLRRRAGHRPGPVLLLEYLANPDHDRIPPGRRPRLPTARLTPTAPGGRDSTGGHAALTLVPAVSRSRQRQPRRRCPPACIPAGQL
jgi:hypothetical protein